MMEKYWNEVWERLHTLAREERGASLVEYALLIALVLIVVVVALENFSNAFSNATNFIGQEVDGAINS